MKANKVLSFRSYHSAKEEMTHATRRSRIDSYNRFLSLKGRLVCILLVPSHLAGIFVKPIFYSAKTAKHVFEGIGCLTWKVKFYGDQSREQAKKELKDAFEYSFNVIASPFGQILHLSRAAIGIIHPGACFSKQRVVNSEGKKVVVIGAGPVGLLTAIQLKILKPNVRVEVIERNENYVRNNRLNLEKGSFAKIPSDGKRLKEIVKDFFGNKKKVSIETNKIEKDLHAHAIDLGINFEHRLVAPEEIAGIDASVVVCADGAHSRSRACLTENKAELPLQHIIQMTYEVDGKQRALSNYRKYPAMKAIGYLVEESARYNVDTNKTLMTVRFFVNELDYTQLIRDENNRPSFKNPLEDIKSDLLTDNLKDAMHLWLNYRQERTQEKAGSIKITPIGLSIYQSSQFSFDLEGCNKAVLVGDAASGVPFFRSLNKGIRESSLLAKTIAKSMDYPEKNDYYFKRYDKRMRRIARKETNTALSKNLGINIVYLFVKISNVVPWQVNKIKMSKVIDLKNKDPELVN